jgi:hypothetical protein
VTGEGGFEEVRVGRVVEVRGFRGEEDELFLGAQGRRVEVCWGGRVGHFRNILHGTRLAGGEEMVSFGEM